LVKYSWSYDLNKVCDKGRGEDVKKEYSIPLGKYVAKRRIWRRIV